MSSGKQLLAVGVAGLISMSAYGQPEPSPAAVSASDFISLFEQLSGKQPAYRKAHARGVCASGEFIPAQSDEFAAAALLSQGTLPVVLRFSVSGGRPDADERKPGVRGVGLLIGTADSPQHVFTGNNFPVFAGKDPETFFGLLKSRAPDADGKTDPARVQAYIAAHPSVQDNVRWAQNVGVAASYANTHYHGIHTFYYQPPQAQTTKFRWQLVPQGGSRFLSETEVKQQAADFLLPVLQQQIAGNEASFRLEASIGAPQDSVNDPSQRWPEDRKRVLLGQIRLTAAGGEDCRTVNFDPNRLSGGFRASDDPVLRMRSAAYAISFGKRLSGH